MTQVSLQDILSCSSLPSLPAVAARLLELTSNPDVELSEISRLVQQDQALAARVLKTVNSSFYGLTSPCGSIERAMGYLGLNSVKSLVLGFSFVDVTGEGKDGSFDLKEHWRRAIIGATGARIVAQAVGEVDIEEAFTASLFQDMGMLACYAAMKMRYVNTLKGIPHDQACAAERKAFGVEHTEVGAELAAKWNLPPVICEGIRHHHDAENVPAEHRAIARLVAVGALISTAMSEDAPESSVRTIERTLISWYGKRAPAVGPLLDEVAETAVMLADLFDQEIGEIPNPAELMARAQEQGFEHQVLLERKAEQLAREAHIDGLTQIANRKRFDEELNRVYEGFKNGGAGYGVLFFDADKFKSVNDTHGHAAGDVVLIELARRTSSVVGESGTVFRYGGEEFAVILEGADLDQCALIAEEVRAAIASTPFDLRSVEGVPDTLEITASIGVSSTDAGDPARLASPGQVVHEADECVYAAKSDGRNNVKVWGRYSQVTIERGGEGSPTPEEMAATPLAGVPLGGCGGKILLIEDDALAATLVMSLIKRRSKAEVRWIRSGTEARDLIESGGLGGENTPSLILCDFGLPGCDGHELLRLARKSEDLAGVPFFMLTGCTEQTMRDESRRLGATLFIHKDEFCADVNRWLGELLGSSRKAA